MIWDLKTGFSSACEREQGMTDRPDTKSATVTYIIVSVADSQFHMLFFQ